MHDLLVSSLEQLLEQSGLCTSILNKLNYPPNTTSLSGEMDLLGTTERKALVFEVKCSNHKRWKAKEQLNKAIKYLHNTYDEVHAFYVTGTPDSLKIVHYKSTPGTEQYGQYCLSQLVKS
ncbi:MAG: hypothetical protein V1725_04190 [archaeon]